MAEFKLTPRMRVWIAVWLAGLIAIVLVTVLTAVNDTFAGGLLGAWCGLAIALVVMSRERAKRPTPSKLARERYGRR